MITPTQTKLDDTRAQEIAYQGVKSRVHEQLIESLDLATVEQTDSPHVREQIRNMAQRLLKRQSDSINSQRVLEEIEDEVFGLGPLETLLHDEAVTDILVNGPHEVFVERNGRLLVSDCVFANSEHLRRIVHRIVSRVGRRIDEVSPMVDARLADGSRVNAVVAPLALNGPLVSIRKFRKKHLDIRSLVSNKTMPANVAAFLLAAVQARVSILISGGTGAGKTTLLNALSAGIPPDERLVTIEDSAELILQHSHVAQLETRPMNSEGSGQFTQRDLVRNSLRMRPDRILIGEVRGAEALDMLQAMNTGHEGSLTTIHANDTQDALARLEMMVAMSGVELPHRVVRQYVASGIGLVVQLSRLKGGVRKVTRVTELRGTEQAEYDAVDLFRFEQNGLDDSGAAIGRFTATGIVPTCASRFEDYGAEFDANWFSTCDEFSFNPHARVNPDRGDA